MRRALGVLALLLLAACGTAEAPPPGGSEAPTVRVGGYVGASYGSVRQ